MGIYCMTQGTQPNALWQPREWDRVGGGRVAQEGGDICTSMADPNWCMAEIQQLSFY